MWCGGGDIKNMLTFELTPGRLNCKFPPFQGYKEVPNLPRLVIHSDY